MKGEMLMNENIKKFFEDKNIDFEQNQECVLLNIRLKDKMPWEKLYIWGYGKRGKRACDFLSKNGVEISGVYDKYNGKSCTCSLSQIRKFADILLVSNDDVLREVTKLEISARVINLAELF